jgi:C4-dicarboxylate-specific signal transduction histidine kinase
MVMKILVVEDEPTCRLALKVTLKKWGYDVIVAESCEKALQILQQPDRPKIIVLDWLMPGMNGVELCRMIRQTREFGYIYIIMLTVRKRREDVATCLEAGADDYIVKPFLKEELRASIATGARRVIADHAMAPDAGAADKATVMEHYFQQMHKLAEEQSTQQLHLDRMATVGLMSAGIAHEINNPTTYVLGSAKNLKLFWEEIEPILQKCAHDNEDDRKSLEFVITRTQANIGAICSGVERILNIADGLKAFAHIGGSHRTACDINACVLHALEFCRNALGNNITIEKSLTRSLPKITADSMQIEQVLINLFVNAADAMEQQSRGILSIDTRATDEGVVVVVGDTGPGISENDFDNIWQPFFTTKPVGRGTGLGLTTVRKIIENHTGKVEVGNKPRGGAEFTITLPLCPSKAEQTVEQSNPEAEQPATQ